MRTSEAEIEVQWGKLCNFFEMVLGPTMRRISLSSIAAFKYWVENGRPFEGEHSWLPIGPGVC